MTTDIPKVALLVDTSYGVRRELLLGITRFVRMRGPWSLFIAGGENKHVLSQLREWGGHGIIARIPDERTEEAVKEANLPTVSLCLSEKQQTLRKSLPLLANVSFDAAADVAQLSVQHFAERRFRNFAFVGLEAAWSDRREKAFCDELERLNFEAEVYHQPLRPADRVWEREQPILTQWISELPKPIAILVCNDHRGRQVLEACRFATVQVPEEVAVLGIDNDDTFCDVADPPLSSIALEAEEAGYRVAEVLDGMMRGTIARSENIEVKAKRVVTRRSSDDFAVNDADVSAALKFIRQQQGRDICVADVADEVAVSRRSLEKQFRKVLGRTVLEEIHRAQLENAKKLLLETSHPICTVAALTGFRTSDYFVRFFHNRVGMTPRDFRSSGSH